jgi:hypothetical protein
MNRKQPGTVDRPPSLRDYTGLAVLRCSQLFWNDLYSIDLKALGIQLAYANASSSLASGTNFRIEAIHQSRALRDRQLGILERCMASISGLNEIESVKRYRAPFGSPRGKSVVYVVQPAFDQHPWLS